MHSNYKRIATSLLILCFLGLGSAFSVAQDEKGGSSIAVPPGEKVKVEGIITSRTGETLDVKSREGKKTVVLTDDTRTKDDKGLFGLDKQEMSSVVLIPGLKLKVDGVSDDQGRVIAKTITVDGDDLETAEMIQAGLHPTAQQVATNVQNLESHQQKIASNQQNIAANQQSIAAHAQKIDQNIKDIQENTNRFDDLHEFDVKDQATLKFNVGSAKVSPQEQQKLKELAQTASKNPGYLIEVKGYADATGGAKMNTKLSEDRAKAVVNYLVQQGNVPVRRIVAPGAMGEYGPAASNETATGRAENRRVEVKLLQNKGMAGKS
jgi:outer membrane protein OmpA-like peptidoglycan-associated protein